MNRVIMQELNTGWHQYQAQRLNEHKNLIPLATRDFI